jgi:hypothetical protein
MLAASDGSLEQSQTKEFWDLFASFQKGSGTNRVPTARGIGGGGQVSSVFFKWDPIFGKWDPKSGEGTRNLQMGP